MLGLDTTSNSAKNNKSQVNNNELKASKIFDFIGDVFDVQNLWRDTSGNGYDRGKKIAEIIAKIFGYGG